MTLYGCRPILASIMYFFISFPLLICGLFSLAISMWAFNRDFYVNLLDRPTLYATLFDEQGFIVEDNSVESQKSSVIVRSFNAVLGPDYLQGEVTRIINDIFDLIENKSAVLNLTINLRPLKQALLSGESASRIAAILATDLPRCTPNTLIQKSDSVILDCIPQDWSQERAQSYLSAQVTAFASGLGDDLQLAQPISRDEYLASNWSILGEFKSAYPLIIGISLFIWLITALIGGGGQRSFLLWLGWTLLMPSLAILAIGILFYVVLSFYSFGESFMDAYLGITTMYNIEINALISEFLQTVTLSFLITGGSSGALSGLLILLGLKSRSSHMIDQLVPVIQAPEKPRQVNEYDN